METISPTFERHEQVDDEPRIAQIPEYWQHAREYQRPYIDEHDIYLLDDRTISGIRTRNIVLKPHEVTAFNELLNLQGAVITEEELASRIGIDPLRDRACNLIELDYLGIVKITAQAQERRIDGEHSS